jgi:adenylate cyclase
MHDATHPTLFRPEQRSATLLFADLRGSTELTTSLRTDPLACELLTHVMDCLSEAVATHDGYIVDYFGDGLMAMWNAPFDQPGHADLACGAALRMLASLPAVTHEWMNVTHTELRLGIGVHTGNVQVGNAGSSRKEKYGPRGANVNLASRVEAATKEIGVPFVATRATIDQLSNQFCANRLCCAYLAGLLQAVDLFSVSSSPTAESVDRAWQQYHEALRQFERQQLDQAARALETIDETHGIPVRFLLDRIQRERGRQLRRRDSDKSVALPNGVVPLVAK